MIFFLPLNKYLHSSSKWFTIITACLGHFVRERWLGNSQMYKVKCGMSTKWAQGLRGLGRVTWWYHPTLMEKLRVLVARGEEVDQQSVLVVRVSLWSFIYMEDNMERTRKKTWQTAESVSHPNTHRLNLLLRDVIQGPHLRRMGRTGSGTELSGTHHSLPFDSSIIPVRSVRQDA